MVLEAKPKSIGWVDFVKLLDFWTGYNGLSVEQLEALEYMKGYSAYYRRIKNSVPRSLLECYINHFPGFQAESNPKTGVKK